MTRPGWDWERCDSQLGQSYPILKVGANFGSRPRAEAREGRRFAVPAIDGPNRSSMSNQNPSDPSSPTPDVRPGNVYLVFDHGVRRRVRVVARSGENPGYWVCEDLDRGETVRLLSTALLGGDPLGRA